MSKKKKIKDIHGQQMLRVYIRETGKKEKVL